MDILEKYFQFLDKGAKLEGNQTRELLIKKLYREIDYAYMIVVEDTLSDEFQILSELREVIFKYARRHNKRFKE